MAASVEIKGVDALIRKLGKAAAIETLRPPMTRSLKRLQRDMADYPPKLPNSTYVQTGTLGRKWTEADLDITPSGRGLQGRIGNNTSYGPWVQSDLFQAGVHRGRWQTDRIVIERDRPDIVADFQAAIDAALK